MKFINDLTFFPNKELKFFLQGMAGNLEVVAKPTSSQNIRGVGVFCHPNPQEGGTLNNKVVTTATQAFNLAGWHSVRFNTRGVGLSEGTFGEEWEDLKTILNWVEQTCPQFPICLGGVSFGAHLSATAAYEWSDIFPIQKLLSVAPTVDRRDYSAFETMPCPWIVIQGEADEVVSSELVFNWHEALLKKMHHIPVSSGRYLPTLYKVPGASHFFNGKLNELRTIIEKNLSLI